MNARQYKQVESMCMYQKLRDIAKQNKVVQEKHPAPPSKTHAKYEKRKT
jgi:hypothetical protein